MKVLRVLIRGVVTAFLIAVGASSCSSPSGTGAADSSDSAQKTAPAKTPYQKYIQDLNDRVDPFWKQELKQVLQDQPVKTLIQGASQASCVVEILLAKDGTVKRARIQKASGFKSVDEAALAAIKNASPLPVPPKAWVKKKFATIRWEFVLKDQ